MAQNTIQDIAYAAIEAARAGDMERARKYKALYQSLLEPTDVAPPVSTYKPQYTTGITPEPESSFFGDIASGFGAGVVGMYESPTLTKGFVYNVLLFSCKHTSYSDKMFGNPASPPDGVRSSHWDK